MSLSAVLLAGGESRRMGRDKAFLEVDGEPLWRRQISKLEQVAAEVLISVHDATSKIESLHHKVYDPPHARGPLAGLASALRAISHSHLLVLAVDLPAMTSGYLSTLASLITPGIGVAPKAEGFFQGTAAIYPREILPIVEAVLDSDDRSFQNLLRKACTEGLMISVSVANEELPLFANWNTPDFLEPKI
jgi:molybdopterin-guanine dinucleotide biosynthesis protein A